MGWEDDNEACISIIKVIIWRKLVRGLECTQRWDKEHEDADPSSEVGQRPDDYTWETEGEWPGNGLSCCRETPVFVLDRHCDKRLDYKIVIIEKGCDVGRILKDDAEAPSKFMTDCYGQMLM